MHSSAFRQAFTAPSALFLLATGLIAPSPANAQTRAPSESLTVAGLEQPVEILRDRWGINHIYAETQPDLFFAQGYAAARDRLFQFEVWRRQATGTVAEILGLREIERDRGARLFQFRGDMEEEMSYYHPEGVEIITSYVRGVNAYIAQTEQNPDLLPMEFDLLGITPGRWTPEVVISRHQGLLGNIGQELSYGRAVHALGAERLRELSHFHPVEPGQPQLALDPAINGGLLSDDILAVYNAFRRSVQFRPEDIRDPVRRNNAQDGQPDAYESQASVAEAEWNALQNEDRESIGSNNWIVDGTRTITGFPMMANDPHRAQASPSLRYWVHLVGPGWNVIGGGEPEIPGVSIGHNGFGAWGLTVFSTDGEDLYVYDTNPANPNEYRYQGRWEEMRVIPDTIAVRDAPSVVVEHKYTRHGPVVFEDVDNDVAYAVRAAWLEIGGAPYLASLRMDQAKSWEEFVEACSYSHIPGENMIWADRDGNIGWQAVGIAPIRRNWSGLVPVPGDGRYEWSGYLPITSKPSVYNPPDGFFGTANSNLTPLSYEHRDAAIGWTWSDPSRWARVNEVLGSGRRLTMSDMSGLQVDYESIPARTLIPLLGHVRSSDGQVEQARARLLGWRSPRGMFSLDASSVEAGIYVAFERRILANVRDIMVTEEERPHVRSVGMKRVLDWLQAPGGEFGTDPIAGRDALVLRSLEEAVRGLRERLGGNVERWQYGQADYKHALIRHPLAAAVDGATRERLNHGPVPRGGNGTTVGNTGGGDNQTSGASFRIIVDTENWDNTLGANNPGQVGDPDSPHYGDLFQLWAEDRFFPVFYSRGRVESVTESRVMLNPR